MNITGTIITLNEERDIVDCIHSLQQVCDEVIVIDSLSTDKTVELAKQAGAKVVLQKYLGDGPQKAVAVPQAKNDWIFSLDADERLDKDAVEYIKNLKLEDPNTAYSFRRKNHVGDHWLKAGGFYPDAVVRLYNRKTSGYIDRPWHAYVKAPNILKSPAHILHYTYADLTDWIRRVNELSTHDASAKKSKGVKPSKTRPLVHGLVALFRKLILKGGIFQGMDGITVAVTTFLHVYLKYSKLNELYAIQKSS